MKMRLSSDDADLLCILPFGLNPGLPLLPMWLFSPLRVKELS
jgi:hypothetical protein